MTRDDKLCRLGLGLVRAVVRGCAWCGKWAAGAAGQETKSAGRGQEGEANRVCLIIQSISKEKRGPLFRGSEGSETVSVGGIQNIKMTSLVQCSLQHHEAFQHCNVVNM